MKMTAQILDSVMAEWQSDPADRNQQTEELQTENQQVEETTDQNRQTEELQTTGSQRVEELQTEHSLSSWVTNNGARETSRASIPATSANEVSVLQTLGGSGSIPSLPSVLRGTPPGSGELYLTESMLERMAGSLDGPDDEIANLCASLFEEDRTAAGEPWVGGQQ